jgi:nucleoside-diphosphate-sugar epimerase
VEDVVTVLTNAERSVGHTVNVGTGTEVSITWLARAMLDLAGRTESSLSIEPRRAWDRVPRRQADVTRLRTLYGSVPSTPIGDGLRRTARWLAAEGHIGRWPGLAT